MARAIKVGGASIKIFGHALYFSEDLLLHPNYFPIDFKEIFQLILKKSLAPARQKWKGVCALPPPPFLPVATLLTTAKCAKIVISKLS